MTKPAAKVYNTKTKQWVDLEVRNAELLNEKPASITNTPDTIPQRDKDGALFAKAINISDNLSLKPETDSKTNITRVALYDNDKNTYADLIAKNLTLLGNLDVKGNITQSNTTEVNLGDNIIRLNANIAKDADPIVDAGIEIARGKQANASILWEEKSKIWKMGLTGSEKAVVFTDDPRLKETQSSIVAKALADESTIGNNVIKATNKSTPSKGNSDTELMLFNGKEFYGLRVSVADTADNVTWNGIQDKPTILTEFVKDLDKKGPIDRILARGSAKFNSETGVTITHNLNKLDYIVSITPTSNPDGFLGEIWVVKNSNNIVVYCSGITTSTTFDYVIF